VDSPRAVSVSSHSLTYLCMPGRIIVQSSGFSSSNDTVPWIMSSPLGLVQDHPATNTKSPFPTLLKNKFLATSVNISEEEEVRRHHTCFFRASIVLKKSTRIQHQVLNSAVFLVSLQGPTPFLLSILSSQNKGEDNLRKILRLSVIRNNPRTKLVHLHELILHWAFPFEVLDVATTISGEYEVYFALILRN
jgi:hypothetical protein